MCIERATALRANNTRVTREYKAAQSAYFCSLLMNCMMSGSSLEDKEARTLRLSSLGNLQHKTLISIAFYFRSSSSALCFPKAY